MGSQTIVASAMRTRAIDKESFFGRVTSAAFHSTLIPFLRCLFGSFHGQYGRDKRRIVAAERLDDVARKFGYGDGFGQSFGTAGPARLDDVQMRDGRGGVDDFSVGIFGLGEDDFDCEGDEWGRLDVVVLPSFG